MMNDTIKEFFPTSEELIDQMLSGIKWRMVKTVLDPSAGKGDLVEAAIRKASVFAMLDEEWEKAPWYTFGSSFSASTIKANYRRFVEGIKAKEKKD